MKKMFKKGIVCILLAAFFVTSFSYSDIKTAEAAEITYETRVNPVIMPQTEI